MANGPVTLRDVYALQEKIELKLDRQHAELMECIDDNSKRITSLEKFKDKTIFVGLVVWGLISVGYEYVKSKFFK